jgi:hypothetical protein
LLDGLKGGLGGGIVLALRLIQHEMTVTLFSRLTTQRCTPADFSFLQGGLDVGEQTFITQAFGFLVVPDCQPVHLAGAQVCDLGIGCNGQVKDGDAHSHVLNKGIISHRDQLFIALGDEMAGQIDGHVSVANHNRPGLPGEGGMLAKKIQHGSVDLFYLVNSNSTVTVALTEICPGARVLSSVWEVDWLEFWITFWVMLEPQREPHQL